MATGVIWSIQSPLAQKVDATRVVAIELASYPPYLADEYSELISRILATAEIHVHSLSGAENMCLLEKANVPVHPPLKAFWNSWLNSVGVQRVC